MVDAASLEDDAVNDPLEECRPNVKLKKEDEDFFSLELLVTGDAAAEVETVEEFIGDAT